MINGLDTAFAHELFEEANAWCCAEEVVGYVPEDSRIRKLATNTFPRAGVVELKSVCSEIFRLVALDYRRREKAGL